MDQLVAGIPETQTRLVLRSFLNDSDISLRSTINSGLVNDI